MPFVSPDLRLTIKKFARLHRFGTATYYYNVNTGELQGNFSTKNEIEADGARPGRAALDNRRGISQKIRINHLLTKINSSI
jgi:hypothetical protein